MSVEQLKQFLSWTAKDHPDFVFMLLVALLLGDSDQHLELCLLALRRLVLLQPKQNGQILQ